MVLRRIFLLLAAVFIPAMLHAQTTTVSGTITDAGGQLWANGTYSFSFYSNGTVGPYYWNGSPFTPSIISGSLDASGSFTASVQSNTSITPSGTKWNLTVCPAATAPCYTKALTITGASQSVTSSVVPPAIRIDAHNPSTVRVTAYADGEIYDANWGYQYFNLTDKSYHVCSLYGSGSGSSPNCTWTTGGSTAGTSSGGGTPSANTCTVVGSFYVQTGGTPGVFICTVVNGNLTWVQEPGTVTLTTTPPTNCTAGTWTYDTASGQLWLGSNTNACTLIAGTQGIAGTQNYLSKFTLPSAVGDSTLLENPFPSLTTQGFSLALQPILVSYINNSSGTTANLLVKYNQGTGDVSTVATSDTNDAIGVVYSGAGTSGTVQVAQGGTVNCTFDGATTKGDYVQISSTVAGDCHDAGSTYPTTGEVLGHVNSTNGAGGTYAMNIFSPDVGGTATVCKGKTGCGGGAGGTVTSVGLSGNGVTVAQTIPNSPITSSGTMNLPVPQSVPAGWVPQGPVPASGTPITIVGSQTHCTLTSGSGTCQINHPTVSGDYVEMDMAAPFTATACMTDSLGNAITHVNGGSVNLSSFYITVTTGGTETITFSSCNGGSTFDVFLNELHNTTGVDTSTNSLGQTGSASVSLTTTANNDGVMSFAICSSGTVTAMTTNPVGTVLSTGLAIPAEQIQLYGQSSAGAQNYSTTVTGCGIADLSFGVVAWKASGSSTNGPLTLGPILESMLPPSSIEHIQSITTCDMPSDVTISTANTPQSLFTCAVTMPNQGAPFRVYASIHLYASSTNAGGSAIGAYVGDGTNNFDSGANSLATTLGSGINSTELSTGSYTNGQSVTFTVYGIANDNLTTFLHLPASSISTLPQGARIQIVIFQSAN